MRKKITYGLLTILLFGGLYLGLRFAFGLFTPLNSWTAQARQDIKNGKIQIVVLGEILPTDELRQSFAKAHGFDFYYFGDNLSIDIINGTNYYNQTMIEYLETKYGSGWWTKFQNQLDSIDKANSTDLIIGEVLDLVGTNKIVKDQIQLIDSLSNGQRHISLIPTLVDSIKNIYLVKVMEDNGSNFVTHFNFLVDVNSMEIINQNGKLDGQ